MGAKKGNKNTLGKHWKIKDTSNYRGSVKGRKVKDTSKMHHSAWNKGLKGLNSGDKNSFYGKKHTEATKIKMRESAMKKFARMTEEERKNYGKGWKGKFGSQHIRYKLDRTTLSKRQERNDMAYKEWRKQVWIRDNYKCRMVNNECNGKIIAHHILSWTNYPELRYIINNGITLCLAHHPRKRAEEKRLIPIFMELVSVSKEKI